MNTRDFNQFWGIYYSEQLSKLRSYNANKNYEADKK